MITRETLEILDQACMQIERGCPRARNAADLMIQSAFKIAAPYVDDKFASFSIQSRELIAAAVAEEAVGGYLRDFTDTGLPYSKRRP